MSSSRSSISKCDEEGGDDSGVVTPDNSMKSVMIPNLGSDGGDDGLEMIFTMSA